MDVRIKFKSAVMVPPAAGHPVAGVIWITVSMARFAGLAVFSRQAMTAGLHPFEVVFLRNARACVLLVGLLVYRGRSRSWATFAWCAAMLPPRHRWR